MLHISVSYCHLAVVLVLQSEVVSLCQVEVDADQVEEHFAGRTLLKETQD